MYIVHIRESFFFPPSVYILKSYWGIWSHGKCTKGGLRFKEMFTTYVLVSSNLHFHPLLSYGNSPQWQPYPFLLGFAFGFHMLQTISYWSAHGLPWVSLFGLWSSYCVLVKVWEGKYLCFNKICWKVEVFGDAVISEIIIIISSIF